MFRMTMFRLSCSFFSWLSVDGSMRCSRLRSKSPIDVARTDSTPSASGMAMLAWSEKDGSPATGLPVALTSVSPMRAYLRMAVGVPIWNLGVIDPMRSALAAFVRPQGVRYLDRDTRPVVPPPADAELATDDDSSRL